MKKIGFVLQNANFLHNQKLYFEKIHLEFILLNASAGFGG